MERHRVITQPNDNDKSSVTEEYSDGGDHDTEAPDENGSSNEQESTGDESDNDDGDDDNDEDEDDDDDSS